MLSTSQEGRGYPAGTMGARFTARGIPARDEGAPIGLPEAVEVVRPDAVRGVVAHGVKLLRSGRGCGGRCGVSAPDVLAKGCRHGSRGREERNGKEIKKGSGVSLPEP